jgi:hypothetical protein
MPVHLLAGCTDGTPEPSSVTALSTAGSTAESDWARLLVRTALDLARLALPDQQSGVMSRISPTEVYLI